MHLLSGGVAPEAVAAASESALHDADEHAAAVVTTLGERVRDVEQEVGELRRELQTLREQFAAFQKWFQ